MAVELVPIAMLVYFIIVGWSYLAELKAGRDGSLASAGKQSRSLVDISQ